MPSPLTEYNPEWEAFEGEESEWSGEASYEVFGETEELDLAAELLAVRDEQELDQFLRNLIRKVDRTAGSVVRSPLGPALGRVLKCAIKTALPRPGDALGTLAGGPLGAAIGRGLASIAGRALGVELEGLSREDQEFEAARRFVRFASEAVKHAASTASVDDPIAAAWAAATAAAQRYAPGLLRWGSPTHARVGPSRNGRWVRRGSQRDHRQQPRTHIRPAEDTMHDIDRTQLESDF